MTWSAVVDSTDRSKARRHMFLWFLILAGLSVEPIADSILSSRIPMYEGIKIMFAGWLLLAHFDISRPESQPPRQNYTIPEDSHNHPSQRAQLETQLNHLHHYPTISRQSSYISATERIPATPGRGLKADGESVSSSTMMKATNLDFGRFKRDLERRRSHSRTHSHATEDVIPARVNSRLGHVEPSPSVPTFHSKEESKHTPTSASVPGAASLQRGHGSTMSTPTTAAQQMTPVQDPNATHSGKRSSLGVFLFGSEKSSLKRPSSAMLEDRPSPSLPRNTSNLSSRSQQPRPSALHRTPSGQRSGGEHRVRINAESPGGKNKRQRHSPDDRGIFAESKEDERPRTRQSKDSQNTNSANTGSKPTLTSASIPTTAPNATTSSTTFSRPKPPRKNRSESQPETTGAAAASKDRRPQRQSLPESTNRDLFSPSATETAEEPQLASASFESRMKNVRAWIKGRNPSMISPTLTATSEATATHPQLKRRSSSLLQQDEKPKSSGGKGGLDDLPKITKRKATRQLAPAANTKRWAVEDDLERPSKWTVEDDDRIQRQNNDGGSRRRRSGEGTKREASRLYPVLTGDSAAHSTDRQRARDFSFSQPTPATRRSSATRISDERIRPSSLPTNVDWDRFQRLIGTAPKRSSSSSTLLNSTVPSKAFHRKSSIATLVNHQDDSPTVSPLIKLRQSQLRQHQEEDFFGVKRSDSEGSKNKFNSTLDLWEQEDDETLARNAAREAEEVEARSQLRLSQGRRDSSSSSPSLLSRSPPKDERAVFTFSSPSRISRTAILATDPGYEMAAPAPSLFRTIPFNGESSRRPVPDFQPKKSASAARLQDTIKSSSPARRTSHFGQDSSNPFLERGTSSGGGRSTPPPPRFNFNFAGAASLAKKRAQSHQLSHQGSKASPEEVAARKERHPGLYTPSKKKSTTTSATVPSGGGVGTNSSEQQLWRQSQLSRPSSSPFKHPSTPTTMGRYIELSSLSDDD
ncbi:hypothetical protein KI688_002676 [Linnemannia hyalina]|uniref:Uncharacterized protein n=1 Tax=Linnemannia hyalina TaxID=64524 RepID=A0A9P8BRU8_9FUNG|nr:hypothetical protein KI688_002676 [Linnemannia hyalina]